MHGVQAVGHRSPCSNQNGTAGGCVCQGPSALQPQSPRVLQAPLAAAKSQDRTSLFLPQNYLSPSFASTKTEMRIFRELIFRTIHFQKGGMKGFLQNIFWLFYLFREGCVLRHKTQRLSAETSDRHTPTLLRYPLSSISHH